MRSTGRAIGASAMVVGLLLLGAPGCDSVEEDAAEAPAEAESLRVEPEGLGEELARPDGHWVESRVADAEERLKLEEVGERVWGAMEAHGGLRAYYEAGPLIYQRIEEEEAEEHLVDTWSGRAVVRSMGDGEGSEDGAEWWGAEETVEEPPYFLSALPFLLSDPGVELSEGDEGAIVARFAWSGEGDVGSYRIYLEEETGRLREVRRGDEALRVEELVEAGGLRFPARIVRGDGVEMTYRSIAFRPHEPLSTFVSP